MKIAVLALGSLAATPVLQFDGPLLPIEFAGSSHQKGLILVLCQWQWGLDMQTPWVISTLNDLKQARQELAEQENVPVGEISYVKMNGNSADPEHLYASGHAPLKDVIIDRLRLWGDKNHFDAVIWRDAAANAPFLQEQTLENAKKTMITYLHRLQGKDADAVEKYFRSVPTHVWTPIRASIAVHFDWMPGADDGAIKTSDDLRLQDWKECRTTIGRIDQSLEDLRKYGFSLIAGLLTASAFLGGFLPVGTSPGTAPSPDVRGAVFIAIMVLITALFSVDTYYQVLLSGAAERALDLEVQMDPPIRVTRYMSSNSTDSKTSYIILFLYLALLGTAGGLGLLGTGVLNWSPGMLFWGWIIGLGVILVASVLVRRFCQTRSDWHQLLLILGGIFGVWFTAGLAGVILLERAAPPSAVLSWVVGVGMLLGVYIELYWVYVAFQTGLHREKVRTW